jgi:hypothetical protein
MSSGQQPQEKDPSLSELVSAAIPEKRAGYIDANIALIKIVSAKTIEDCVDVALVAIPELAAKDRADLLDPPLPVDLSEALQLLAESADRWTSHEFVSSFLPSKFIVNPDAVNAAELMLSAVVDYGGQRSLTRVEQLHETAYGVHRNG